MYYLNGILHAMYLSGEHLSVVSFCKGKLFVGGKSRHQAKISSLYVEEFFFEGNILKIEIYIYVCVSLGKSFVRENY